MPRHVVVSPEEDLASYYGGADPQETSGASSPPLEPPAPVGPTVVAPPPASTVTIPRPVPPPAPVAPPPPPAPLAPAPPAAPAARGGIDPVLAAILSFFLPGLGQLVAGQTTKGVALLVLTFVSCGLGGILNVVGAIDAYLIAQRRQRGEVVAEWQFF